jgi:hypothetical protein
LSVPSKDANQDKSHADQAALRFSRFGLPPPLTGAAAKLRMADKQVIDKREVSS